MIKRLNSISMIRLALRPAWTRSLRIVLYRTRAVFPMQDPRRTAKRITAGYGPAIRMKNTFQSRALRARGLELSMPGTGSVPGVLTTRF